MKKITLEINNSIYDYIMFFLENIPKNLLNIKKELKEKIKNDKESSNAFNPRDFFGVGNSSRVLLFYCMVSRLESYSITSLKLF